MLAVMNQKGGVGKTTTAVNLAAALALAGKKVCLIDLDPQAHASLHLGVTPKHSGETIYEVLVGEIPVCQVISEVSENLSIVPAHIDLAASELELANEIGREMILRDALASLGGQYDYILFDCPPSLGVLTLNALTAADEVLLPLQPHFLALHGFSKLLHSIELVAARLNPTLRLCGIVLCMYDRTTKLALEVESDLKVFLKEQRQQNVPWQEAVLFKAKIRRNIRLAEAPSFGTSIFEYDKRSNGAADYLAFREEFLSIQQSTQDNVTDHNSGKVLSTDTENTHTEAHRDKKASFAETLLKKATA